ncbi:hypothetical protein DFH27DRAFT_610376 [Peziza echinospora]|nr:hypothetical protein DFH27DRAFT_610376 [Peziza echinospora]
MSTKLRFSLRTVDTNTSTWTSGTMKIKRANIPMVTACLILWMTILVSGDSNLLGAVDMLVVPLTRTNNTNSVDDYAMRMKLGDSQIIHLLPVLYSFEHYTGERGPLRPLYVPSLELCDNYKETGEWNQFLTPTSGQTINTQVYSNQKDGINEDGTFEVKWKASSATAKINLTLRRGKPAAEADNITVIDMGLINNGIYRWNASRTVRLFSLDDADDYSLMLSTDSPPRRSYSNVFTMRRLSIDEMKNQSRPIERPSFLKRAISEDCVDYVEANGGIYNRALDFQLTEDDVSEREGLFKDIISGWQVQVNTTGSTKATVQSGDMINSDLKEVILNNVGINLITSSTQGMGIISVAELQRKRNEDAGIKGRSATDVIGIYLGAGENAGHVVLGGHDSALIDRAQGSSVFGKRKNLEGQLELEMVAVTFIPDAPKEFNQSTTELVVGTNIPISKTRLRLSYNSPTIMLPEAILDKLLPYLGAPLYNKELNGYVFEASPKLDYSLKFTFANSTKGNSVNITISASALFSQETTDNNPLTPQLENGRKFLMIAPLRSSDGPIGYLGRAFLKHVYLVDDYYLERFYMSAVNTTALNARQSNLLIGSYGLMDSQPIDLPDPIVVDEDDGDDDHVSTVGPILGGVIGGLSLFWIVFLFFYLRSRHARSRQSSKAGDEKLGAEDIGYVENRHSVLDIMGKPDSRKNPDIKGKAPDRGGLGPVHQKTNEIRLLSPPPARKIDIGAGSQQQKTVLLTGPATLGNSQPLPSGFIISAPTESAASVTTTTTEPPIPPVKDEKYKSLVKHYSQPLTSSTPAAVEPVKRKSAPAITSGYSGLGGGLYDKFGDEEEQKVTNQPDIGYPKPTHKMPTYQELIAQHQARQQRASWVDSNSSNNDDNEARSNVTSSTETATLGKVIGKGQVAKVRQLSSTPPHVTLANALERRASVGRVMSAGDIVVVPPSRRSSRGSRELLSSPGKTPSPAGSSSGSGSGGRRTVDGSHHYDLLGHRRGKSAPMELPSQIPSPMMTPPPRSPQRPAAPTPPHPPPAPPTPPPPPTPPVIHETQPSSSGFGAWIRAMDRGGTANSNSSASAVTVRRIPAPVLRPTPIPPPKSDEPTSPPVAASSSSSGGITIPRRLSRLVRGGSPSRPTSVVSPVSPLSERGSAGELLPGGYDDDEPVSPVTPPK